MSTPYKKIILVVCILLLSGATASIGVTMYRNAAKQREIEATLEAERAARREIADAYIRVNYAFAIWTTTMYGESVYAISGRHWPLPDIISSQSPFGISFNLYLFLRMYYHQTGIILDYEKVIDYFSEEFEPDGSLRLYNNGNHPEIESFVIWMWDGQRIPEAHEFVRSASAAYEQYVFRHKDDGFDNQRFVDLSPQMLDALARALADSDYALDLTSLQQQGY